MDAPAFLSRLQFAFTVMFNYIYPPLMIASGVVSDIAMEVPLGINRARYRNGRRQALNPHP